MVYSTNVPNKKSAPSWSDVAETCLLTMYCHAAESQTSEPILNDIKAVEISRKLTPELDASDSRMLRRLAQGKINPTLRVHLALRARKYDQYAREFIARNPGGSIVNIGCGMDSRCFRIESDSGGVFFDLDLPEVIGFKRNYFEENERYRMIASSVLDHTWMEQVAQASSGPFIFLAEGVFMYLEGEKVRQLVITMCSRFRGSELVCEVVNRRWIRGLWRKMVDRKMQRSANIGESAMFKSGLDDSREMERWDERIKFLDDWSYLDSNHKKLGMLKLFRNSKLFRNTQYTVHYFFV
jgi:methyltransferase (TIGR00027 family)